MTRRGLWPLPGRWLGPLVLALFALLAMGLNATLQWRQVDTEVEQAERRRLIERLSVEQSRLILQDSTSGGLPIVRGVVGGLGLYKGMRSALLVQPDGRVQASLRRTDIGRDLAQVLAERPALAPLAALPPGGPGQLSIVVERVPGTQDLVGMVPFSSGRRILVRVDIGVPLAVRQAAVRAEALREGGLLFLLAGVLALIGHFVWFRRAARLANALAAMGEGHLERRTGVQGRDELALIGAEADRMAERLQHERERLQQLHALVDRSPVVVVEWVNGPGWPISYLSRTVAQWGYERDVLLGGLPDWDELVHPEDLPRVNAEIAANAAAGIDDYRQEYRLRCADGRWVWVEDHTSVRRDARGDVASIGGIVLDITEQKQAQTALREQGEVQRLFFELPFIGMAISSPHSKRWLQVNDQLCAILGYPRETLLNLSWADMTPRPDLDRNLELLDEMLAGKTDSYQMQKRFVRGDGRVVHTEIHVRAVRLADGTLHRLFSTVQDITERLRANQALVEHQALLEQAEGLAGLGSWRYDARNPSIAWSGQMFRNMGIDPAQGPPPTLADYLDCVHPEDRERVEQFLRASASTDEVLNAEFRRHPRLGDERWFRASVQRHPGPDATLWHYSGTLLDITPLMRAQLALQRSNAELEQRVHERTEQLSALNRELEAFTYSVSHDLKAPLRGIDGYSQLLEDEHGAQLNEQALGYLRRVRRGVAQMATLIAELLSYSRMERRTLEPVALNLREIVQRVLDDNADEIERSHAEVRVALPALTLHLDREGLLMVLRNLVSNALKFTRPGEAPRVEVGARTEATGHRIWVRDHGVGFDMKHHDRVFGIFQRLHRADEYPGTGVGLALVAKAVQRMGGRVWAHSEPGQGATFTVEFPV